MIKFKLLSLGFVLFTFSSFAQTKQNIVGTWQFEDFYKKNELKMDSTMINTMKQMFSDMVLTFNENNSYIFNSTNKTEKGSWAYAEKTKKLIITKANKSKDELTVIAFTENSLTLAIASMRIVFKRKL